MNSRSKGATAERELADLFLRHGVLCQRTAQYCGMSGVPDIRCEGIDLHVEVKRTEKLRLADALAQVERDRHGRPWVICYRASRMPWLVIQPFTQWTKDSAAVAVAQAHRAARMAQNADTTV